MYPRVLRILTYLNLVLVAGLIFMENMVAERHWLSMLITYLPQAPFAVPTFVLLVLTALRRDRILAATNALVGVLVVFVLLGFNLPLHQCGPPGSRRLRVMTYNLRQGEYGIINIVKVIDKHNPDIVCLQEVNNWGAWGDPVWQIEQLQPKRWHVVRDGEIAILSRHPIIASKHIYLPMNTRRAILAAQVSVRGRRATIITTHFNVGSGGASFLRSRTPAREYVRDAARVRLAQTAALLDFAGGFRDPVVITGDLNTPPRGFYYRRLASAYRDAFAAKGWGFGYTYRSRLPILRIDYIFTDRSSHVADCFAAAETASDHRPVVADIIISF